MWPQALDTNSLFVIINKKERPLTGTNYHAKQTVIISYKETRSLFCWFFFWSPFGNSLSSQTLFYSTKIPSLTPKYEYVSEIYWKSLDRRFESPSETCQYKWLLVNFYKTNSKLYKFPPTFVFCQSAKCFSLISPLISLFYFYRLTGKICFVKLAICNVERQSFAIALQIIGWKVYKYMNLYCLVSALFFLKRKETKINFRNSRHWYRIWIKLYYFKCFIHIKVFMYH